MPDTKLHLPPAAMREHVLATLAELIAGGMTERMRVDAAARIIVTARRLAVLSASGHANGTAPGSGPLPEAVRTVNDLASGWDPEIMTAREYAEVMMPVELDALLACARPWATRVWETQLPLPEVERRRSLALG